MAKGTISHIEFPADDIERAKKFYAAVAGWEFNEMDGMAGLLAVQDARRGRWRHRGARRDGR